MGVSMRAMSDFYAAAIVALEGYGNEETDDTRLGEAVGKIAEYTIARQEDGIDGIDQRKPRLARLEADFEAIIDAASPETATGAAVAAMRVLVDAITVALQAAGLPAARANEVER